MLKGAHKVERGSGSDGGLNTYVAVYFLLLAFLVTLHSISDLKLARVGAAIHSLNDAFDGSETDSPRDFEIPDNENLLALSSGAQPFVEEAAVLLHATLVLDSPVVGVQGGFLSTKLPANRLFIGASEIVRPEFDVFLRDLSLLIAAQGENERSEIEFVFGFGAPGEDRLRGQSVESARQLAFSRSASLARKLIESGIPAGNAGVGVRLGASNRVIITFRTRQKDAAGISFEQNSGTTG
jgi:hypothetical protein